MEIGGKMPAYCPGDELSLCKLSRVCSLLWAVPAAHHVIALCVTAPPQQWSPCSTHLYKQCQVSTRFLRGPSARSSDSRGQLLCWLAHTCLAGSTVSLLLCASQGTQCDRVSALDTLVSA